MTRITREDVTTQPWRYTSTQWLIAHDIHIPHIAEISPMQYWHLSKAGKRRYDAKREEEWSAAAAGREVWRDAVLAAFDAGTIDTRTPDLSSDAKGVILDAQIARRKQREEEERKQQTENAQYQDVSELRKGDHVFIHHLRVWVDVVKVNRKTVTVAHPFGNMSIPPQQLYRLDPRTLA